MASAAATSAVQDKSPFFHFRATKKKQAKNPAAPADVLEQPAAPQLTKLSKNKPQALAQGGEKARKGSGLWDCLGLAALCAAVCFCCEGSGNGGYGRRGWANKPENAPKPNTGNAAV